MYWDQYIYNNDDDDDDKKVISDWVSDDDSWRMMKVMCIYALTFLIPFTQRSLLIFPVSPNENFLFP